jgi:TonB family protein
MLASLGAIGQAPPPVTPQPAVSPSPTAPTDADLDAAQLWIGRALFLRGSYLANDLNYGATGQVTGSPKSGDWTLSGVDLKKVERHGPQNIQLDGIRVAIRYNADTHEFERHPQKDANIKILVADPGSAAAVAATFDAIFAQGIDPRLQQATPAFWQHYFNPALPWPQDTLAGQQVFVLKSPIQPDDPTQPVVSHKTDAKMTTEAEKDRIHGVLQLRMVVDAQGVPQRIAIMRPLGYGLDERAVEAITKWRFTPAMRQGQPVASMFLFNYEFVVVVPPHL